MKNSSDPIRRLLYPLTILLGLTFAAGCAGMIRTAPVASLWERAAAVLPAWLSGHLISAVLAVGGFVFFLLLFPRAFRRLYPIFRLFRWREFIMLLKPESAKAFFVGCLRAAGGISLSAAVGLGLLTLVFSRPVGENVEQHMRENASVIAEEGMHPDLTPLCLSRLDNFTDSIMLLEASDDTEDTALNRAILAYRGRFQRDQWLEPCETLVEHYGEGVPFDAVETYPRYWHGYLVFLRPLLNRMNYASIRTLNGAVQTLLLLLLLGLMKKCGLSHAIPLWLLSVGMLMPLALARSFQYSSCYYILTLGIIALLLRWPGKDRRRLLFTLFLSMGIATAYFDFLTYPLAVYGLPMTVWLLLSQDRSGEEHLADVVRGGIFWCVGYGGMWAGKWALAALLAGEASFSDALWAIALRTSVMDAGGAIRYGVLGTLLTNILAFCYTPLLFLVLWLLLSRLRRTRAAGSGEDASRAMPFLVLAVLPLLWYAVLRNHSAIHFCFTNKALSVTLFALLSAVTPGASSKNSVY